MHRAVRSVSLLAGVLALQFVVMSDGVMCGTSVRAAARGLDAMPGMDMGKTSDGLPPADAPCGQTDMPASCKTLLPCAPLFVASAVSLNPDRQPSAAGEVAFVERIRSALALPPEPPPPRA